MRAVRGRLGRSASHFVFLAMTTVAPVFAQVPSSPDAMPSDTDRVIVTGTRQALQQAADIKRDASQIEDVITAEDVGKLPDENVAEALQRVTGVQITRVFGEGQAVSIRGLQQVRVEVDGRTLLGWSSRLSPPENENLGRSSGLDSIPSSLFGRLEVRKSPVASQVEGGLGGTVNLVTPRPFDFDTTVISLRAAETYGDVTDRVEPRLNGLFTTQLADGRVGILLSGEYQKRTSTTQTLERNNYFERLNGGSVAVKAPQLLQYENFVVDRTRTGLSAVLQWALTPELSITADGIYSEIATGREQNFLAWRLPNSPSASIILDPVTVDGFVVAGTANGTLTTAGQIRNEPSKSYLYALNGRYAGGPFTLDAEVGYSSGSLDQSIEIITLQANGPVPGVFDFRSGAVPSLSLGQFDTTNYANFTPVPNAVRANRLVGELSESVARLDASYSLGDTTKLSAGLRYASLQSSTRAYRSQVTPTRAEIAPFLSVTGTSFLPELHSQIPKAFLRAVPASGYVFNRAQQAQPNPASPGGLLPNSTRDYDLSEETFGGYVMIDSEMSIWGVPIIANAGLRVISTDFVVDTLLQTAGPVFTPVTDTSRYTDLLPSVNLTLPLSHDLQVRLAASRTMQRAGIAELAPSLFVNVTNRNATGGNAQLKPPKSDNLEISIEYYLDGGSTLSAAVFYKDVTDFIASNTTLDIFPGYESLGEIPYTRPDNVSSAKVKGIEVGMQTFFDWLPAPFDGFGMIANYTYSDAQDSNGFPLVATSRNSFNLIGLYEMGGVSARLAYNFRDEALFEFTEGRPNYVDSASQLDAQISYDLTDNVKLEVQGQNLLPDESAIVEYSVVGPVALNSYALSERRFSIGLRARF